MNLEEVYMKLRLRGLRPDEAAAMVGYAMLVRQVGWEGVPVSHRHRRNIKRTLARVGVEPHDIRCGEPALEPGQEGGTHRKWHAQGVLLSGRTL